MLSAFAGKRVLLLQGPMGLFFTRLRGDLQAAGAEVFKVNFCAGDRLFYPAGAIDFRGTLAQWPTFLADLIVRFRIDAVFLFGDCRHYHRTVPRVVRWCSSKLYVFEEGYIRPDYITVEPDGANNFSTLSRDPDFYRICSHVANAPAKPLAITRSFSRAAFFAMCYAGANFLFRWRYPHYRHHRPLNPFAESFYWLRSGWRKLWFRYREARLARELGDLLGARYFLVPLQTHNDAQIHVHSGFSSIEQFIEVVLASFARCGNAKHRLVFKHHPLDRGYRDYSRLLRRLNRQYGLEGRVIYVHDVHLPTLLDRALGTIVVNSTVGLSSLLHDTPVCVLGDPVYHMRGLTFQGDLDDFWNAPGQIDRDLFWRFHSWLLAHNQANGNFYRRLPSLSNRTGVVWPAGLGIDVAETQQISPRLDIPSLPPLRSPPVPLRSPPVFDAQCMRPAISEP